jgi:hypothetical protein
VQRWAREGKIPAHPLNDGSHRDWRFLISELDAWLRARGAGAKYSRQVNIN